MVIAIGSKTEWWYFSASHKYLSCFLHLKYLWSFNVLSIKYKHLPFLVIVLHFRWIYRASFNKSILAIRDMHILIYHPFFFYKSLSMLHDNFFVVLFDSSCFFFFFFLLTFFICWLHVVDDFLKNVRATPLLATIV